MNSYSVHWDIELDANNPQEAARTALEWIRSPNAICTIFEVREIVHGSGDITVRVDTLDTGEIVRSEPEGG